MNQKPEIKIQQIPIQNPKNQQQIQYSMQGQHQPSTSSEPVPPVAKPFKQQIKYKILQNYEYYFENELQRKIHQSAYNIYSIIPHDDQDRKVWAQKLTVLFEEMKKEGEDIGEKSVPEQKRKTQLQKNQIKQTESSQKQDQSIKMVQQKSTKSTTLTKTVNIKQFLNLDIKVERGIASLLGLAICDALGASTQFIPFVKDRRNLIAYDFQDVIKQIRKRVLDTRSGRIGIWTDDCSMALCMADSLMLNQYKFNAKHMRFMFHMWLEHGLDNGGRKYSIGLGGNIAISMREFRNQRTDYTDQGDKFNNGNGSLMRLAPVPICFVNNQKQAMEFSEKQSRTTHNGDQAKQCSKLLALILVRLINRGDQNDWKSVIQAACKDFVQKEKTIPAVQALALSKMQSRQLFDLLSQKYGRKFTKYNKSIQIDRNWNWKDQNFTYSKTRAQDQPGYVGSYCMDALSMALHTVWHSKSFQQVALWNANMGGDCDTVGAVAGQIAGAIYGIQQYMMHLYSQMEDCKSGRFQAFMKGYKLMTHRPI